MSVKERPILFKGDMVRAILDGRKTQTRRAVKPKTLELLDAAASVGECYPLGSEKQDWEYIRGFCPYGKPGDRLWVREAFGYEIRSIGGTPHEHIVYRASNQDAVLCYDCNGMEQPMKWRPSIHMPRWASRILLEITDVRVERLQDINTDDIRAEGVAQRFPNVNDQFTPKILFGQFMELWQSINGVDSWNANPYVWVVEFRRIDQ